MSHSTDNEEKLMFQPFSSILTPGFWQQLSALKLSTLKLSKDPVDVTGSYLCNLSESLPCLASFDHDSFKPINRDCGNKSSCSLHGQLVCTNIMQEFIDFDKKQFLNDQGKQIWQSIVDGRALAEPEQYLSRYGLIVHADLKKYKFVYWFSFPALNYPKNIAILNSTLDDNGDCKAKKFIRILDVLTEESLRTLQSHYDNTKSESGFHRGYFVVQKYTNTDKSVEKISVLSLEQYKQSMTQTDHTGEECTTYFAYSDPSASQDYPGWPLRNFLCLIAVQFQLTTVNIIKIRRGKAQQESNLDIHHSMVFQVKFELSEEYSCLDKQHTSDVPLTTGWEKNESKQLAPKRVELSNLLDPKRLADDAVNLNLKLMKWRLIPSLNLDKISNTRCLLLGCGTLGCHIARGLVAWGVTNISIVDNAKISYSNPARQTLYTFEDCIKSKNGTYKAIAAAEKLKKIHPSLVVHSHILSIPMPGHPVGPGEEDQTMKDIATLERLIEEHDAIFLLMDTRESRWLPSVIAMSKQKLVINAAIGFDTFLLQRYGIRNYHAQDTKETAKATEADSVKLKNFLPADQLGCYFCNDIVAPGDSTIDRTLDQQCTVSRPGVSMLVSAMAVELLAAIVSSDMGIDCPGQLEVQQDPSQMTDEECFSDLGIVPHTIRGNLARYHVYMPTCASFNKCSACSEAVINAYRNEGSDFLLKVFQDPSYLEEVAGLKELQNVSDNVWALESDDEIDNLAHYE